MADAAAVLRYFARLAPASAASRSRAVARRSDFAPIGWLDPRAMLGLSEEAPPIVDRTARLDRLVALDRLHETERLLRVGWLWLVGHDERAEADFLSPLLSAPVRLERTLRGYRPTVIGDAEVTDGLIADREEARAVEDMVSAALTIAGPGPPAQPVLARYTQFKAWLRRATEAVGVLSPDVVDASVDPWDLTSRTALGLVLGLCIYVARDVDRATMAADLANWAGRGMEGTGFEAVYGSPEPDDRPADGDDAVASAFPLNEAQRTAIRRTRTERVTVVSGPPGTGKSHLAAALAVDEVGRGHTVLLATQSDYAADVLADLLTRYPGPRFVRFGNREHRRQVADELSGGMASPYPHAEVDQLEERLAVARDRVAAARARITRLLDREVAFTKGLVDRQRLAAALVVAPGAGEVGFDTGEASRLLETARSASGLFADRRRRHSEDRLRRLLDASPDATLDDLADAIEAGRAERAVRAAMVGGGLALGADWEELTAAEAAWRLESGRVIEARRRSRQNRKRVSTQAVSALASALRSGRAKRRKLLRDLTGAAFLDVLPLWLGTLREIDDTLPVEPAMFDVVILDESSQIDQLRSAPALCRAARVVVVGDPRQLRHVSFVGDDAMDEAAGDEGIEGAATRQVDVRRNSLFDAAAAVASVTDLLEHFRSVPHIIGFSNKEFYGGRLRLMTQHPATEVLDAIRVIRVDGVRNDGGWVAEEVAAVEATVRRWLASGASSIGVLSPFRSEADALETMLLEQFGDDELAAGGVRVGTVHAFQGNERDLVVAALGIGRDDLAPLGFLQDPHLFNVMITRARREMVMVTALDPASLPNGLLSDYLRWEAQPPHPPHGSTHPEGWIAELTVALAGYELPVVACYPVAGYQVDLSVGPGADAVGIECLVFEDDPVRHVERHMALLRAGWRLGDAFRSRWLANPEGAVAEIVDAVLRRQVEGTGPTRAGGQ